MRRVFAHPADFPAEIRSNVPEVGGDLTGEAKIAAAPARIAVRRVLYRRACFKVVQDLARAAAGVADDHPFSSGGQRHRRAAEDRKDSDQEEAEC